MEEKNKETEKKIEEKGVSIDKKDISKAEKSMGTIRNNPNVEGWTPKTELGKKVKEGKIKDINEILDNGIKILEPEIVDALLPNIETELLLVGQAKGKFGGGQRRIFRQTQKKTKEGNNPQFLTVAIVGTKDGFIGVGYGKSKETVPAREKALKNAKLNLFKIGRGCGSWECGCDNPHSIPFGVEGKLGAVKLKLIPAPKGTGLVAEKECRKILTLAGIKDIWSKTIGKTKTKLNLIKACETALKKTISTKTDSGPASGIKIVEGSTLGADSDADFIDEVKHKEEKE